MENAGRLYEQSIPPISMRTAHWAQFCCGRVRRGFAYRV